MYCLVKVEDIAVNVLTSVITTLIIIFLLIPLLGIPIPVLKETETTKKYYYPYVMPVELEGDYSTWTQKDYSPTSDAGIDNRYFAYFDEVQGIIYIGSCAGNSLKKIDLETGTLSTLLTSAYFSYADADLNPSNKYVSILHKYLVIFDFGTAPYTLRVFKDGSLVFSFQLPIASTSFTVSISPSGRWIIVIDDTNNKYYVLEGS